MKRNTIILITGLILATHIAGAQNPEQERLNAYRIAFITNRLKLTPAKVIRLYQAENQYRQQLLKELQQRREQRIDPDS